MLIHSMKNKTYRCVCVFSLLFMAACSTDYALNDDGGVVNEKLADIEREPITRLSFVPAQGGDDEVEVIVYNDDADMDDIQPASGSVADAGRSN